MQSSFLLSTLFVLLAGHLQALPAPMPDVAEIAKAHTNPAEFLAIHSPAQLGKCFAYAHTPIAGNPGGCGAGGGGAVGAASTGGQTAAPTSVAAATGGATATGGAAASGGGSLLGGLLGGLIKKRDANPQSLAPAGQAFGQVAAIQQGYQMTKDMLAQFPDNPDLIQALKDYKTTWPNVAFV